MKQHYTHVDGNAGRMYAAIHESGEILGAVLIGATTSEVQSHSLAGTSTAVRVVKRLFSRDDSPIKESQLLRAAARDTANRLGVTCAIAAYAEPCARDTRTQIGMVGKVYACSNFFFVGYSGRRRALLDSQGCVRSPRQGKITLTLKTTPPGWRWVDLPPAPIWMTIVTPQMVIEHGALRMTSERWCKREWRRAWAAIPKHRRVAAKQWTDNKTWSRLQRQGRISLWNPEVHEVRDGMRRQSALWLGHDLKRTAAPVLPPRLQAELPLCIEEDETTAGRLTILRETGMHCEEVLDLRLEDVLLDPGREGVRVREPKNRSERIVILTPRATPKTIRGLRAHLKRFPQGTARHVHLFTSNRGTRVSYDALRYQWQHVCTVAKLIDINGKPLYTLHQLRHTRGTELFEDGQSLETAQRVLGHRDPRSTLGYAELNDQQVRSALERPPRR